ncbi:threonine/homoserine/homoserine lactone efflux protein [Rhizomicrobium palustre]|uniref:Threonine/homoserine/homoserine lactone efflux protein n=1 Tax=Rhizomicrobium palustre TaxID=189966 RepID=A0A846N5D9_9PROT|nr:LysE family translocator [Rhizomicrobium palustre]NIK90392.1 threonine/homoserine/homoserine lactone efflux protein [Rhizomicrobium palustre]
MLSAHSYLIYCTLYAICIAVPGPGVVAIVARALGSGFRSSIAAVLGTLVGDLVWMTLSAYGLAAVATAMGGYFLLVKYAGALYLCFMGYKYWRAEVSEMPELVPASSRQSFFSQLSVTLGNPKAMAFFLAILPTVVDLKKLSIFGYGQLVLATAVLIPSIMLAYAALAAQVRMFLTSRKARKTINRTAAVVMFGAGAGVAVS